MNQRPSPPKKVLVIGGVSYNTMVYVDRFPDPKPQTYFARGFHKTVGFSGVGKALNLHKLGVPVSLHGLIGDDEPGQRVQAYFAAEDLPFCYDVDPLGTKRHVNLMDRAGGRISIFLQPGTLDPQIDLERIENLICESDIIALNIVNYCRALIPLIKQQKKEIWCDIHDYDGQDPYHADFIAAADVLLMSSDATSNYHELMEGWIAAGKKLAVCTHGKDGASALTPAGNWIKTPILPDYPLVDSNGAGDSYFAGLLYGHLRGDPIERSMQWGTIVSGLCVTSKELVFPDLSEAYLAKEFDRHYGHGSPDSAASLPQE